MDQAQTLSEVKRRLMDPDDRLGQTIEKVELTRHATQGTYLYIPGWVSDTEMNDDLKVDVCPQGQLWLYTRYPGTEDWMLEGNFSTYEALSDYVLSLE